MASKNHIELILMCCFFVMFVFMALADDCDSVNGTENNAPVTDGIEKT